MKKYEKSSTVVYNARDLHRENLVLELEKNWIERANYALKCVCVE